MSSWAKFTIGSFSLLFAWIFVISRVRSPYPGAFWALAGFCVLIALACFSRTARTPALRIIGAVVFLTYVFYVASEIRQGILRPRPGLASLHWLHALEGFFVFGLPGLYLAARGIYPAWGRGARAFRGDSDQAAQDPDQRT